MKHYVKAGIAGIFSGIVLGAFLWASEEVTGRGVYTLLMNVDYFPVLKDMELNAAVEFFLHIAVSVTLAAILFYLLHKKGMQYRVAPYLFINLGIGGALYLTTNFSERTPAVTDGTAFLLWMAGHVVYGFSLWALVHIFIGKGKDSI